MKERQTKIYFDLSFAKTNEVHSQRKNKFKMNYFCFVHISTCFSFFFMLYCTYFTDASSVFKCSLLFQFAFHSFHLVAFAWGQHNVQIAQVHSFTKYFSSMHKHKCVQTHALLHTRTQIEFNSFQRLRFEINFRINFRSSFAHLFLQSIYSFISS